MSRVQEAVDQLGRLGDAQAKLAALEAFEAKRKQDSFIKYWRPVGDQKEALPQFTQDIKVFGVLGGNRSGKTELGTLIALAFALGKDYFRGEASYRFIESLPIGKPPNNIWVVGLDFNVLGDVIWGEKFLQGREHPGLLPKGPEVVKINSAKGDYRVVFSNGSIITGKSADSGPEKFQSAAVDLIWIDEECDEPVFDECYQRTVSCGGKILLTLTPLTDIASGARTPWVFDLYEKAAAGERKDTKFVTLSVLNNPYVPEEEKVKLREKWAGHFEEPARLYGKFIQRSGLVYNMWARKTHIVEPITIPGHWRKIVSIDPSATGTTAALWGAVDSNGNIWLHKEYYESGKVISEHAKSIRIRNAGDVVDLWIIDPKFGSQRNPDNHKSNLQLYRESGIPVRLAEVEKDFGMNASLEYMNATLDESARHPKVYVFKDLYNFIDEIEHYSWAFYTRGEMKGMSKDKPRKVHDHLMNAWQYMAAMRPRYRTRHEMTDKEKKVFATLNSYT